MRCQQMQHGLMRMRQRRSGQRRGAVGGSVSGLQHGGIANRQRRLQFLQPRQQQFPAGLGAAAFNITHMPLRDTQPHREFKLAQAPRLACLLQCDRESVGKNVHGDIKAQTATKGCHGSKR